MFDIARYDEARSVEEAVALLAANPKARLIAGGTDVLIHIREGKQPEAELVGIRHIPELARIEREADGTLSIGAAATFSRIVADPLISRHVPVLADAVETVGGPQIRRVATIGGNVCNGATSADSASTLFALDAVLQIQGPGGVRLTPIRDFYAGPGRVHLGQAEVLTAIRLAPESYEGYGGHYIKYAMRKAMDIATLGCSVNCKVTGGDRLADVRLAFGVAAPTPVRCLQAEEAVKGKVFSPDVVEAFGHAAAAEINPRTSWRASREFRLHLAKELSKEALVKAYAKAGGIIHGA
ncbi:xanthine dehydrogenase FAD-binding subunit XdhB [Heliobacterium gestii]|uniref:Xanthine dehydrogenase FAD-binding subunit XdhB n=1 Tax=Heliomicrobium gestii TaxID=2699 RepID=A0A845LHN2_HELGE|nr:xanthine dehydrogenase subunit XdhB [Heliomicrobium gestii]MBM7866953.1 xanthine dehydrogenase FAD-binding subunit [Heliomicrobium gestii]MZP42376.1 xanthine dehydrogenase FAD-binding subunit XdhB [Heliomicrobium gestii]